MISAHRLGVGWTVGPGGLAAALAELAEAGVAFVEFDVQRCADGVLVAVHDDTVELEGGPRPIADLTFDEVALHVAELFRFDTVIAAIGAAGLAAHLDLKFTTPTGAAEPAAYVGGPDVAWEVTAIAEAVAVLGPDRVVVTTKHDRSVAAVRTWAVRHAPGLMVGLSFGTGVRGLSPLQAVRRVRAELFPRQRFEASGANLLVAHYSLARITLARLACREGVPLLVWTVDSPRGLRYWLAPGRAWLVTTNTPFAAAAIQAESESRA